MPSEKASRCTCWWRGYCLPSCMIFCADIGRGKGQAIVTLLKANAQASKNLCVPHQQLNLPAQPSSIVRNVTGYCWGPGRNIFGLSPIGCGEKFLLLPYCSLGFCGHFSQVGYVWQHNVGLGGEIGNWWLGKQQAELRPVLVTWGFPDHGQTGLTLEWNWDPPIFVIKWLRVGWKIQLSWPHFQGLVMMNLEEPLARSGSKPRWFTQGRTPHS